jgi:transcription termination/antitermination protein NusA
VNLSEVIEGLVEERGLDREKVVEVIKEGVLSAFQKKFPEVKLVASFNKKLGEVEIFAEKTVVSSVKDESLEVSLRRARTLKADVALGDLVAVPFEDKIGRIEILVAKQIIASRIRELEQSVVYKDFVDKRGTIFSGIVHKKERGGVSIKVGEVLAFLPMENFIPQEQLRVGHPIKVLLNEVLAVARGDYQLILDRASADFVRGLIELEIPEVFEGVVEIKKIVRMPGYKTKAIVFSNNKEIDPVGTCVGVGGSRIKPILRELGQEKIDLIEWTESLDTLVKNSLKPAEIDKVELIDEYRATVWLAQDQRSVAIGKMGQNIMLASKLVNLEIQLQDVAPEKKN